MQSRRMGWLVLVFFASLYLATLGGHLVSIDDEVLFRTTVSLANRGSFAIQPLEAVPHFAVGAGPDGRMYSSKGAGMPLLTTPAVPLGITLAKTVPTEWLPQRFLEPAGAAGGVPTVVSDPVGFAQRLVWSTFNVWVSALTCWLLFELCALLGQGPRASLSVTMLYGCGTMAWVHATHANFVEPLLTLCTLAAVYAAVRFAQSGQRHWLFGSALACGLAALTKVYAGLLFPAVGMYLVLAARRDGRVRNALLPLGAIAGATLALLALYNFGRYANVLETGYGLEQSGSGLRFSGQFVDHLLWLWFSWGKGLLFYATPVLLFFPALPRFSRRFEPESVLFLLVGVLYLGTAALWYDWQGGIAWGPRLLLPMVPLWIVPVGFLLERPRWRALIALLFAFGLLVQGSAVCVNWLEWYTRASELLTRNPNYRQLLSPEVYLASDSWMLTEAVGNIVCFRAEWCPIVGNLQVLGSGGWDLFWFAVPAEFRWQGGRALLGCVGLWLMACAAWSGHELRRRRSYSAERNSHEGWARDPIVD